MMWWYVPSPCYVVVAGSTLVPRTPPTLEQLLWTIRDAWPPPALPLPRSLSLDSEKRKKPKILNDMGTGGKLNSQSTPRMGLPFRRYSVPETVMRKYSLSRAQTSASDVVTAPTPSVPSLNTSQDSATKRMSHKACQTSPQDSDRTSNSDIIITETVRTIPTVNVIPDSNLSSNSENITFKSNSNSNELSPSEEVSEYSASESQAYRSDLHLPGAVALSNMFLTVPETYMDPHDSPKEGSAEDNILDNDNLNVESPCAIRLSGPNSFDNNSDLMFDDNFQHLLEQTAADEKRFFFRLKSNSVPESAEPVVKNNCRPGSADEKCFSNLILTNEEHNPNLEQNLSSDGTPTPAPTCHTYDSQGNMSECYITDCDMCTAEGRKCCSLDDSGSQSCSFTSPEMITTNELKSSSDYTTSSMTLDQTVSDRTTSTQDSTVSLTSITPESSGAKDKLASINISPILVIHSESILVDMVSPKNKSKDRELFHPSDSSPSESSKSDSQTVESLQLSDSFPMIISCESAVVPKDKYESTDKTVAQEIVLPSDPQTEMQFAAINNEVFDIDVGSELNNNTINDLNIENNKSYAESKNEQENDDNEGIDQEQFRNYSTNYMYLTEDESGGNIDSLEVERESTIDSSLLKADEYEMDSLALNESTEEDSNLLENLGFCEDLSQIQYQPSTVHSSNLKVKSSNLGTQEMFYGNTTYQLLLKENSKSKTNFMGNVMPVFEENVLPEKVIEPINNSLIKSENVDSLDNIMTRGTDVLCLEEISEVDNSTILVDRETTMGSVAGGTYWELPGKELVVPRFSALPRTLSMIVNTSSVDCSSDSDLSLPDSLEDSKDGDRSKGLKLYNKYDNRLVRGDVIALLPEESEFPKKSSKESKAYFLSLTGEECEIKVEQIPEELKQKLLKRDNGIKKHSDHQSIYAKEFKVSSKRAKKHHHHHCKSKTPGSSCRKSTTPESTEKISTFTQWEDLNSSKDSSDTLVPSDFSEKDTVFNGESKAKDVSTSPFMNKFTDNFSQNHCDSNLHDWLQKLNSNLVNTVQNDTIDLDIVAEPCSYQDGQNVVSDKSKTFIQANKWVQCDDMPHVDSDVDREISQILINNLENDKILEIAESRKFKCIEHQIPWSKDFQIQVSENDLNIKDQNESSNAVDSKAVQTSNNTPREFKTQIDKNEVKISLIEKTHSDETNNIQLNLAGPLNEQSIDDVITKIIQDTDNERSSKPVPAERSSIKSGKAVKQHDSKVIFSRSSPKLNIKSTPSRRPGNLGSRFRQRFEVIPEEKSGSVESSNDERKSPLPSKERRASMPSDIILADLGRNETKSSDSSTSSNGKPENEDCDRIHNVQTSQEGRRHTIHGNLSSTHSKTGTTNTSFEKNEQSRRHTIHGSLALNSKNDSVLRQLNLLGGTLLKGRVFGKQSGVMFGRFRPINEETQVQKDERSFVEEHLERLTRDTSKGREALAVAKAEEQEDLLTLSKGWINFYLLRDSQEMGSDGSLDEEGSKDLGSEERLRKIPPPMKTVTVVGKSEEELRHQYTVQINASPELYPEDARLPNLGSQQVKTFKTPPLSPDITLPDITPSSSPTTSPLQTNIINDIKQEFPQIRSRETLIRDKRDSSEKFKQSKKQFQEQSDKKQKMHKSENDKNVRYLKLSSMKQELQTEKTYFARSGEVACSELSPSSKSSSSSVTVDSPTLPSIKWPSRQLQRRAHTRHPRMIPAPPPQPNPQACWTVTLAGSSGHPTQPPPDVEMRLSFSNMSRGAATSQSDSGLGEDGPSERTKKQQALPPSMTQNNQWKVKLKETERSADFTKGDKRNTLPDFSYTPSTARSKKSAKRGIQEDPSRPLSVKVQEILEHNISLHKSSVTEGEWIEGLSVTGLAITPERKPRVPTMSERDLTRQWLHRSRFS